MASSMIIMSEKLSKELNISQKKKNLFAWFMYFERYLECFKRPKLSNSSKKMWRRGSLTGNVSMDSISYFDIYSCFPSAVQIAMKELSLNLDDNPLTKLLEDFLILEDQEMHTIMFSSSEMVRKLRKNQNKYGMITANSWFLTKHAINIFSSKAPPEIDWNQNFQKLQKK